MLRRSPALRALGKDRGMDDQAGDGPEEAASVTMGERGARPTCPGPVRSMRPRGHGDVILRVTGDHGCE